MIQPRLATVINFCSNDYRFLEKDIEEARKFSRQIIIPVCDHFFDGTEENYALLESIYRRYPDCLFVEYEFDPEHPYGTYISLDPSHPDWGHHWHNTSRLISFYFLKEEIEQVFFMDADEVPDGTRILEWLNGFPHRDYEALRLSSYYYFRHAKFRATAWPDAGLLVKKEILTPDLLLHCDERMGLYLSLKGKKEREVSGLDGKPLVHHFSWVKTKKEMLKKCQVWAHHWERDWVSLIEKEFDKTFDGSDFIRHYEYVECEPPFDPLACGDPALSKISLQDHLRNLSSFSHVIRINAFDIFRKDLMINFNL